MPRLHLTLSESTKKFYVFVIVVGSEQVFDVEKNMLYFVCQKLRKFNTYC